jgi:uncharacterized protein
MYIKRLLHNALNEAMKFFPAVLVTGPRQSGKTTLLRHELANQQAAYVSFDDPLERDFAHKDPHGFLDRFQKQPVILDEIQYVPELLQYLKIYIDKNRQQNGCWILTGSQQFQLMHNVSESLAGRIAILELLPFSILEFELKDGKNLPSLLWYGCYPEPALNMEVGKRDLWLRSYVQTYIERDLRQLQHIHDLSAFERFILLMAARHAQVFNATELAREIGISAPTIKSWGTLLEAAYICYFLPPYFKNYGKRITKTPKLYFIDSAIVAFLTRQPSIDAILAGPMGGAFFEGLIISEAVKVFTFLGKKPDLFFWRSHDGLEVDLLIQMHGKLYPVEIKMTATPTLQHLEPLNKFKKIVGNDADETGVLVCRVPKKVSLSENNIALPWHEFSGWLMDKLAKV